MSRADLSAPAPLTSEHELDAFDCGDTAMTLWLRKHALPNQYNDASRTFVVCEGEAAVVAYYSIAAGSIERQIAPGAVRRNMPDPIPVIVLGRLAVDTAYQDAGLGRALLRDAMLRVLTVSRDVAVKALVVHAISAEVVPFYARYDFVQSPDDPQLLILPVATIAAALNQ